MAWVGTACRARRARHRQQQSRSRLRSQRSSSKIRGPFKGGFRGLYGDDGV